ncbi:WXG100 family type VII secretion target [Janibacter limosus]|uniref:WXG100 family type VII secretion target n=1 Tax=Janibacter limosus TaxID=53458 RepID=A0AC61U438_9MICO|nr:WXG100 family type VII secretion target [Janibacter limosus]UUZ44815.1 WXG100 family type VII secretion target [Janibacter limosus]
MALTDGMDPVRIREVARQLTTESGKIEEVVTNGTTRAGTLAENWIGNDSEQFASSWQDAVKSLQAARDLMTDYAKTAVEQADQQRGASGATSD